MAIKIMDYEKAYNEALERAKQFMSEHPTRAEADLMVALFPELAESEEERIRKWIASYIHRGVFNEEEHLMALKAIDWLEKQKINTEGDFGRGYDCGYEACLNSHGAEWFEKQKEPSVWDSPIMTNEMIMGKQKEQKPVEYLSKDKVYAIMNKLTELSTSDLIPIESEEYVKIHEITSDVCSLLNYPIEQKPAEWSEEDEMLMDELKSYILYDKEFNDEQKAWRIKRLKSLRPQPQGIYQ